MQNESGVGGASTQQSNYHYHARVDEAARPFSDTSSFVHVADATGLSPAAGISLALPARPAQQPGKAASAVPPPSSSHEDLDSLLRHAQQHGEHLFTLRDASSSFLRRYNKLAPIREEALLLRSRVDFEWMVCADHRRFVADSQDAFLKEAALLCASLPQQTSVGKLQALYNQVVRDHQEQLDRTEQTRDTETKLSNLEYSLQQKEHRLAQAGQKIADALTQLTLPGQGGSEPSSPPSEVDKEEVPHLVHHYFDKAGDVKLEREKMVEMELEHREAREIRMFQADQDLPLPMSDEEFEELYNKAYLEASQGLAEVLRKAELAKAVCISEGLDPELYRNPPSEGAPSSEAPPPPEPVDVAPASHEPTETPGMAGSPSILAIGTTDGVQTPPRSHAYTSHLESAPNLTQDTTLSQGLSSRRRKDKSLPLEERVSSWIAGIDIEGEGTQSRSRSRARSTSESIPFPIELETLHDGTMGVNKSLSHNRRYQRHGSLASYYTGFPNEKDRGEGRSGLLKRSSSESELFILPLRQRSYQDAVDSMRAFVQPTS